MGSLSGEDRDFKANLTPGPSRAGRRWSQRRRSRCGIGRRPLTDSGASSTGLALSSGPGRSQPRPAPRTFGFQSPQPLGGARSRVGGPEEEEEAAQDEEAVPGAPARGWAELASPPPSGRAEGRCRLSPRGGGG